jgi:hypothetical protein
MYFVGLGGFLFLTIYYDTLGVGLGWDFGYLSHFLLCSWGYGGPVGGPLNLAAPYLVGHIGASHGRMLAILGNGGTSRPILLVFG